MGKNFVETNKIIDTLAEYVHDIVAANTNQVLRHITPKGIGSSKSELVMKLADWQRISTVTQAVYTKLPVAEKRWYKYNARHILELILQQHKEEVKRRNT